MKILGLSSDGLLGYMYAAPLGMFSALGGHFLDAGTSLFRAWGTRPRKHVSGGGYLCANLYRAARAPAGAPGAPTYPALPSLAAGAR